MSLANDASLARERFAVLGSRDGSEISDAGRSRFYTMPERVALGVVLLHGLTNAPQQWAPFASQLHAAGVSVVIPRFPGHGYRDTHTRAIASVTARDLTNVAALAVDVATAAADRVVVVGLSVGAQIAAALALEDPQIARVICISPFFGIAHLNFGLNVVVTTALDRLPNAFLPWDPRGGASETPPYAYPRFPTRVLGECLALALTVQRGARRGVVPSGDVRFLLNAKEPACNNALAVETSRHWNRARAGSSVLQTAPDFPPTHDVVDEHNPQARPDVVYPRIRALVDA